jgi:cell division septal protein FtsQ
MRSEIFFDEKQRKRRRRILRLKIYGGTALFFILIVGLGYLVAYSSLFHIAQIHADCTQTNAENAQTCTGKEKLVVDLKDFFVRQSKIAEILGPDNILIWKNKTDSFLKNYPQIAELTIKKDYFKRQIEINYKEREKFGIWCLKTQTNADYTQTDTDPTPIDTESSPYESVLSQYKSVCWWFDKNGVIFAEAPLVEGELINKVFDSSGRELKIGDKILKENLLKNLLKIFEVLQKSELSMKNLYLQDLSLQEVVAQSLNLPKIYFSLRIDPEFTLTAIESLKNLGLERIEYIDFRVENRAYYKIK